MNAAATAAALDAMAAQAHCPRRQPAPPLAGPYRERLRLPDGRGVLLRPAHHRDAAALQRFFAALSPRARLLRFHAALNALPDRAAAQMSTQVPARHVALLALADDGELAAEARYAVDGEGEGDGTAEFGIAVGDAWQGQGLGRALLLRLAFHARENGVAFLRGSVMAGNEPMLALLRSLGADLRSRGSEVQGTLALRAAGALAPVAAAA